MYKPLKLNKFYQFVCFIMVTRFHFCSITKPKALQLPATLCPYDRLSLMTDSQSNNEYRRMSPSKKRGCRFFCRNITNNGPCYHHRIWAHIMQNAECVDHHSISYSSANDCVSCGKECIKDLYWICDFLSLFILIQKFWKFSSSFLKCSSNQGPRILEGRSRGWRVCISSKIRLDLL